MLSIAWKISMVKLPERTRGSAYMLVASQIEEDINKSQKSRLHRRIVRCHASEKREDRVKTEDGRPCKSRSHVKRMFEERWIASDSKEKGLETMLKEKLLATRWGFCGSQETKKERRLGRLHGPSPRPLEDRADKKDKLSLASPLCSAAENNAGTLVIGSLIGHSCSRHTLPTMRD